MRTKPPPPAPLSAEECLLIELLAKTDALFAPYRWEGEGSAPAAIWNRRRRFPTDGIVTAEKNAAATRRQQRSRMITSLTQAGLLARSRPRSRTRGIRLTTDADELLRSLCGLPGLDASFATMRRIADIGQTDQAITERCYPATAARPLIREIHLLDPARQQWLKSDAFQIEVTLELQLAPALWRGFVESHCDAKGRGHYMLTEAGLAILADDRTDERAAMLNLPATVPASDLAISLYYETRTSEALARRHWADEDAANELGYCPLSCSLPTKGELAELARERAEGKAAATP